MRKRRFLFVMDARVTLGLSANNQEEAERAMMALGVGHFYAQGLTIDSPTPDVIFDSGIGVDCNFSQPQLLGRELREGE